MLIFVVFMSVVIVLAASIRQNDLNEIESKSEALEETLRHVEEANRLKSQFLATMSHELRTPLNAIIGFAEVMMMGLTGDMAQESQRTTARIHDNSKRLLQLIDDLLDISKIEAGRIDVIRDSFSPVELATTVEQTLKPKADEKSLDLEVEVDSSLPQLMLGDMHRLEQIALNLVTNAIKFTNVGTVKLSLKKLNSETLGH